MSSTVSNYLSAIPASAPEGPIATAILGKIAIAASTANTQLAQAAKSELPSLLTSLVDSLIARGKIPAATILALVAAAAPTGGHVVNDVGVLGTVTVSGSAIVIAAGAY